METSLGTPTASAVLFFLFIVALTLAITYWAARRTRSTRAFYAALALYVALLSEVAAAAKLTAESRQLEVVWGKLVGIGDADVLWRERYQSLLKAAG